MSDRRHLDWLLEQTAQSARTYLEVLARIEELEPGSDERETLEGQLAARLLQLELDARDARAADDAFLDSLPDEEATHAPSHT